MKISARNQIKGKIVEVTKGATKSHVRIDIGNGAIVTRVDHQPVSPNCNRRLDSPVLIESTRSLLRGRTDEEDSGEQRCKKAPAEGRFAPRTVRRDESRSLVYYHNG